MWRLHESIDDLVEPAASIFGHCIECRHGSRFRDRPLAVGAVVFWTAGARPVMYSLNSPNDFCSNRSRSSTGKPDSAIDVADSSYRLKRQCTTFNRTLFARVVDGAISGFTREFFSRNAGLGSDWEAPILIVGMPRSGTTLVEQILSSHPDVDGGGELTFWGERASSFRTNAAREIDPAWVQEAAHDYRALLAAFSATAQRVTDKRPNNFLFLGLVHAVFPWARVIHCRRHPVDTCLSIYFQNFASRMDFAYDREDIVHCYRHYLRLMAHWRNALPADRLLDIQYEELVADREAVTRKLIAFCGLDWNDACLRSERNRRAVQTASVWQARQPVYKTSVAQPLRALARRSAGTA